LLRGAERGARPRWPDHPETAPESRFPVTGAADILPPAQDLPNPRTHAFGGRGNRTGAATDEGTATMGRIQASSQVALLFPREPDS